MRTLRTAVLAVAGIAWLLPVYVLVVNGSKAPTDYDTREAWLPDGFGLAPNVLAALRLTGLADSLLSTMLYSLVAPALAVLVGAAAGFAIVALRLRHGFAWFVVIFGGTVFPLQMILLPLFDGFSRTGLYDSRIGMLAVYTVISVPFSAFVMRNFFSGVAHSVFEAAVIDGATTWRIFTRIYLPMATSALAAVFILQATFIWNDLLLGLTLTQTDEVRPIVTTLAAMQNT